MLRVLVTRPEPGASRTARRLQERGFQPVVLPLTETVALPADAGFVTGDAVAVTSANAVRHTANEVIAALAALPCHAVGARTAEAARKMGFSSVIEGSGDAEALADAIAAALPGKAITYLCGRVRFPMFEQRLEAAGVRVRAVETYDTLPVPYSDETILALLSGQSVDAVLLYSAKAAVAMQALSKRPALQEAFEKIQAFALSARIAAAFGDGAGKTIRIAARPDEEALLALLRVLP
ncbi:uroporphyrinogen-III synthase [Mesorhizobium loti]|uniref:Uroporphyrinogen-III synthase n=1 Tax=Mesorhizobium jarvisii TaxID=1777867 RepID=A0A6M7TB54_9HYPH|nr:MULTISPECIES: uroporphyrinogen-III synthase [Mesorhizobium]OBQ76809.1 uroporphyrinogen III synthase [Mesorhizobium loti]QKC61819.1 uroporphyrinogen-III synthase [Mesorhizobium jarvisii]QKD07729.1 uroporphyrinogen-III synthase [Mesorhizobium loti]RJT35505.1 uroporphyrinogen-III synthase [Mesorhizobium jarvisii]BCG99159.1 uroporphyrinogen III methyltransferase [Mesorhizobium sp. 131-2-5]